MTKEEAIKYLQQLYPNGGHCWLDEQRIEAIGMAIKALQEESVSEDLETAANEWDAKASFTPFYMTLDDKGNPNGVEQDYTTHAESFKAGAKWKKEQFEKNRLAACDRQTEEEAEIEQSFVMGIIECENRQPTFDDAIKYGMRLQKEQIKEALLSEVLPYFMHGGEADEVVAKLDEVLNQKK